MTTIAKIIPIHPEVAELLAQQEAAIQKLETESTPLRERAAGYDRLRTVNGELKGRIAQMENRIASAEEVSRRNWTMYLNGEVEVRQLKERLESFKEMDRYYGSIERQNESLKEQVLELGRQNIALAAEAETAQLQTQQIESQLAAADARVRELEAALVLASLPAGSRDNVIQMVREAA